MVTGKSCCVSDSDDPLISEAESLQFLFLLCGDLQDVFFLAPIGGGVLFCVEQLEQEQQDHKEPQEPQEEEEQQKSITTIITITTLMITNNSNNNINNNDIADIVVATIPTTTRRTQRTRRRAKTRKTQATGSSFHHQEAEPRETNDKAVVVVRVSALHPPHVTRL